MNRIHPTLVQRFFIDEREFTADEAAAVKRNFEAMGPLAVESRAVAGPYAENVLQLDIKVRRAYWPADAPDGERLWAEDLAEWLRHAVSKAGHTLANAVATSREAGEEPFCVDWLELRFGEFALMRFAVGEEGVDVAAVTDAAVCAHALMASGAWGDAAGVNVPSRASYDAQRKAWAQAQAAAEAAAEGDGAAADGEPRLGHALFAVDASVWGVVGADGAERAYDPDAGVFAE